MSRCAAPRRWARQTRRRLPWRWRRSRARTHHRQVAEALDDHERGHAHEAAGKAHGGHGERGGGVPADREGPVAARTVRERTGEQAPAECRGLSEPRGDADNERVCPERGQKRPLHRECALVDDVHQHADDAKGDDEGVRPHRFGFRTILLALRIRNDIPNAYDKCQFHSSGSTGRRQHCSRLQAHNRCMVHSRAPHRAIRADARGLLHSPRMISV